MRRCANAARFSTYPLPNPPPFRNPVSTLESKPQYCPIHLRKGRNGGGGKESLFPNRIIYAFMLLPFRYFTSSCQDIEGYT